MLFTYFNISALVQINAYHFQDVQILVQYLQANTEFIIKTVILVKLAVLKQRYKLGIGYVVKKYL